MDSTNLFNQAMEDIERGTISVTPGDYYVSTLRLRSFVHLECNGARFFKIDTGLESRAVSAAGQEGVASALTASANRREATIQVADGSLFQPRTWALLRDNRYIDQGNGRNQEIVYIVAVSGNQLTLSVRLHREYLVANAAQVVNIAPVLGARLSGAEIILRRGARPAHNGGGLHAALSIGGGFFGKIL
ncbi:hypothetical protein KDH83_31225, partial [Achromobacter sp. Marseille-Q0513]|uniref:hypothetical protein n=1 Tax=Achromobacter sp. Marseille-Q0513 TaxID=2829161 RepID=UPI001B970BD2